MKINRDTIGDFPGLKLPGMVLPNYSWSWGNVSAELDKHSKPSHSANIQKLFGCPMRPKSFCFMLCLNLLAGDG